MAKKKNKSNSGCKKKKLKDRIMAINSAWKNKEIDVGIGKLCWYLRDIDGYGKGSSVDGTDKYQGKVQP